MRSGDRIVRVQRLSRVDTDLLGKDPQYLTAGLIRFRPRADGSVPTPDEIIDYAGHQITRRERSPCAVQLPPEDPAGPRRSRAALLGGRPRL